MSVRGRVTFDRALEIIRIILQLRSQIRCLGPDADIMRIIAASRKCGLFWSRFDFTTNYADIIRIIEFVNGVSKSLFVYISAVFESMLLK